MANRIENDGTSNGAVLRSGSEVESVPNAGSVFWSTDLEDIERSVGVSEDVIHGKRLDQPTALVPLQGCVLEKFDTL